MKERPKDHEPPEVVGHPIEELDSFSAKPDPELLGRVQRGINRNILAADGVDFSLSILVKTIWSYMSAFFEALAPAEGGRKDDGNG